MAQKHECAKLSLASRLCKTLVVAVSLLASSSLPATTSAPPQRSYYLYVCAESDDTVHLLRFGPQGFDVLKNIRVGSFPAETEGPHGINISPDGKHWFVSIAHGMPFGSIHKYETGTDDWVADVSVGLFPATMQVSPATGLLYVVNFNLHGDMEPSTISVVETATMIEVARIDTGIMPHGARMNAKGTKLYSVNMMDDTLVEVDALTFEIGRTLALADGAQEHSAHPTGNGGDMALHTPKVKPTWASAPTANGKIYVAGNGDDHIYEIDLAGWRISRRLSTGEGTAPYNLDVTPDGEKLVATYKSAKKIGIWDLAEGTELAVIETTRRVPHGVAISDDNRYAFVSIEGVGGEPGSVEVYDLETFSRVAVADVGKQAGGIVIWKAEP